MRQPEIIITTTPTIDGANVEAYLGVLSAHVVAGTNIFSDIFAGLSDFFGGRSGTYQKQLDAINNAAISELKEKAQAIGANAILGIRIDHDEISGGGKSMFMVTAAGTAVRVDKTVPASQKTSGFVKTFSHQEISDVQRCNEIIRHCKTSPANKVLGKEEWSLISRYRIEELAESILAVFQKKYVYSMGSMEMEEFKKHSTKFFSEFPEDWVKDQLYGALWNESESAESSQIWTFAVETIEKLNLFDPARIRSFMESDNFQLKTRAMKISLSNKEFYTGSDVSEIQSLASSIEAALPKAEVYEKKGKLSSKTKEFWNCHNCEKQNTIEHYGCVSCQADMYGLRGIKPIPEIVANLRGRAEAVSEMQ